MSQLPKEPLVVTFDDLPCMLPYISSDDRDVWVQVGMGLKAEFGDAAFDTWDQWSSSGEGYDAKSCISSWKSFKLSGIGIGTTVKLALDNGWKPEKKELTPEEKKRLKKEAEERRAEALKKAEADEKLSQKMQFEVANACFEVWDKHCAVFGKSPYLERKKVKAYGVRFLKYTTLLVVDFSEGIERAYILTGVAIKEFFDNLPKPRPDTISYLRMVRKGIVVPFTDENNILCGFQYINEQGTKLFPKFCKKSGSFHLLGQINEQTNVLCFAEGYATAATVHEATGYPTVVTFDAGNMGMVGEKLHHKHPALFKVFAGDDDVATTPNAGRKNAEQAALTCNGLAVFPDFTGVPL